MYIILVKYLLPAIVRMGKVRQSIAEAEVQSIVLTNTSVDRIYTASLDSSTESLKQYVDSLTSTNEKTVSTILKDTQFADHYGALHAEGFLDQVAISNIVPVWTRTQTPQSPRAAQYLNQLLFTTLNPNGRNSRIKFKARKSKKKSNRSNSKR